MLSAVLIPAYGERKMPAIDAPRTCISFVGLFISQSTGSECVCVSLPVETKPDISNV